MAVSPNLETLQQQLTLSPASIENVINGLIAGYKHGLTTDETIMIPSYVCRFPTGHESGTCLAMDFGGTNLRVALVKFLQQGNIEISQKSFTIPDVYKSCTADELFDWFVDCVKELDVLRDNEEMRMGITFSYPIKQTAINKGVAMKMGKGFLVSGLEGHDVVELLNLAFKRQNLKVHTVAIVNDCVGALVAYAYKTPNAVIGVIFGTGTNAACIVPVSFIKKQRFENLGPDAKEMIINTEWSIIGHDFLPFTKYDLILDEQSTKPKFQPYEKMMGAYYLRELTRLTLVDFIENAGLFGGRLPDALKGQNTFDPMWMSKIESESDMTKIGDILKTNFGFTESQMNPSDIKTFQGIIRAYSGRAAQLAAAGFVSLMKLRYGDDINLDDRDYIIAIEGSFFHNYHKFAENVRKHFEDLVGHDLARKIKFDVAQQAGCIGAAVVAIMYSK